MRWATKSPEAFRARISSSGCIELKSKKENQQAMILEHPVGVNLGRDFRKVNHLRALLAAGDLRQFLHVFQAEIRNGLRNSVFEDAKIRLLQIRHRSAGFVIHPHVNQHFIGLRAQDKGLLRTSKSGSGRLLLGGEGQWAGRQIGRWREELRASGQIGRWASGQWY